MKYVAVGDFSPMLYSIIAEAVSNRSDVTLVRRNLNDRDLDARPIDVVLMPASEPDDLQSAMDLLWRWPKSRVIAIAGSGLHAIVYELQPHTTVLGDLSPATLVDAIDR